MMPFMSKKKKFKFQVHLGLEELSSVPFVSGILYAKVRLNKDGGTFLEHSPRQEVHNNCVLWGSEFEFPCKMTANMSSGVLDPCTVRISVRKEVKGGKSQHKLGYVDLNLACFAGGGRMSKRYLLEGYDTKHRLDNSNVKVSVELSLVSGDPVFKVPSSHSVSQSSSVTGTGTDPVDLRPCDNHSEDSLASSSSGFSSLTRRGRLPDGMEIEACTEGLGHQRSASYASQQSRGSGYGSYTHSRQSSVGSMAHSRQSSISSFTVVSQQPAPGGEHAALGHTRTPSSVSSTLERRRNLEDRGVVVVATRVDPEALVNEVMENTDLNPSSVDEASGLQLLVQKDGTMALR